MIKTNRLNLTARKTIFSFSRRPEKMVFRKKSRWNIIFHVLSGKIIFLFPENMILPPGRKMKDDLSKKMHDNMIFFFRCSEKMVFSERSHWNKVSLGNQGNYLAIRRWVIITKI